MWYSVKIIDNNSEISKGYRIIEYTVKAKSMELAKKSAFSGFGIMVGSDPYLGDISIRTVISARLIKL